MPYDVVFYTPDHKTEALALVRTLTPEEIQERGLNWHIKGLRFWFDSVRVPNAKGEIGSTLGSCVATNFEGSASMPIGGVATVDGVQKNTLWKWLELEEFKPGLTAGCVRFNYYFTSDALKFAHWQRAAESAALANWRRAQFMDRKWYMRLARWIRNFYDPILPSNPEIANDPELYARFSLAEVMSGRAA